MLVPQVNILWQRSHSAVINHRTLFSLNAPPMVVTPPLFLIWVNFSEGAELVGTLACQPTRGPGTHPTETHDTIWFCRKSSIFCQCVRPIPEGPPGQKMVSRILSAISHLQSNSKIQSSFQDVYNTRELDSWHTVLASRHPFQIEVDHFFTE